MLALSVGVIKIWVVLVICVVTITPFEVTTVGMSDVAWDVTGVMDVGLEGVKLEERDVMGIDEDMTLSDDEEIIIEDAMEVVSTVGERGMLAF